MNDLLLAKFPKANQSSNGFSVMRMKANEAKNIYKELNLINPKSILLIWRHLFQVDPICGSCL